jgi:hypothetical protein
LVIEGVFTVFVGDKRISRRLRGGSIFIDTGVGFGGGIVVVH